MKMNKWLHSKGHPNSLNSINNLAVTYFNLGQWKEAA